MVFLLLCRLFGPIITAIALPIVTFKHKIYYYTLVVLHLLSLNISTWGHFTNHIICSFLGVSIITGIFLVGIRVIEAKKQWIRILIVVVAILHVLVWRMIWIERLAFEGIIEDRVYEYFDTDEVYQVRVSRGGGMYNIVGARPYLSVDIIWNKNFFFKNIKSTRLTGTSWTKELDWKRINPKEVEITLTDIYDMVTIDTVELTVMKSK